MDNVIWTINQLIEGITPLGVLKGTIDILIVSFILYKVVTMLAETRATGILRGVIIVLTMWGCSYIFNLEALNYVIEQVMLYGVLGLMILFQPELRTALERLGKTSLSSQSSKTPYTQQHKVINDIVESTSSMSKRKVGALIVIERRDNLQDFMDTGIKLDAMTSVQLLENIFSPNMPLHDGAIFIRGTRIVSASGYLPLTDRTDIPKHLGTRHRAGIGLSEDTDALIIIVSEETGVVSFVENGEILRPVDADKLRYGLETRLILKDKSGVRIVGKTKQM